MRKRLTKVMLNIGQVVCIYTVDSGVVKAETANSKPWVMGRYGTETEGLTAIGIIAEKMRVGRNTVCFMPLDAAVKAKMTANSTDSKTVQHTATGKKLKGHGGS